MMEILPQDWNGERIEGEKQDAFMTLQTIKINLLQGAYDGKLGMKFPFPHVTDVRDDSN